MRNPSGSGGESGSEAFLFGGIDPQRLAADRQDLVGITSRLGVLAGTDVAGLAPAELAGHVAEMVALDEQLSRLIGSTMQIAERCQTHTSVGEKSMAALIRAKSHVHLDQAAAYKAIADALNLFPSFAAAYRNGTVSRGHVRLMSELYGRADTRQVIEAEPWFCINAIMLTVEDFRDLVKEWEALADINEHYEEFLKAQAKQHLWYGKDVFGNLHGSFTFDPVNGETFVQLVEPKIDELWRLDQQAAKHDPTCEIRTSIRRRADALLELVIAGSAVAPGSKKPVPTIEFITTQPLTNTCTCGHVCPNTEPPEDGTNGPGPHTPPPNQPTSDTHRPDWPGTTDMAQGPAGVGSLCDDGDTPWSGDSPFSTDSDSGAWDSGAWDSGVWDSGQWLADLQQALEIGRQWGIDQPHKPPDTPITPSPTHFYGQTLDGKLIPHRILTKLAAEGKVNTTYVDANGNPLHDPTLASRDFTDRQKRQIRIRDRHCQHHGCRSPAHYCQYDHVIPVANGGPTKISNGQLLCRFHHKWKHRNDPKPHKRHDIQLE